MKATAENRRIWEHYQNAQLDVFKDSKPRLAFLVRQIERRARNLPLVLTIGVGDGFLERASVAKGWRVWAVDPDERTITAIAAAGVQGTVGAIERLPYVDGSFDFVVASEVLEHLTEEQGEAGLAEVARVLRPGGYFLGTVPHDERLAEQRVICPHCGEVFHRWGHCRSFNLATTRSMLAERFTVERVERTAFAALRGRGARGFLKGTFRIALAKIGEPIASANIWWAAKRHQ